MSGAGPETNILVVEDDEDILNSVQYLLENEGYKVRTALNGVEALENIEKEGLPKLILLDMTMPLMDGWVFASEFRNRYPEKVPFVVMTAAADAEQRARDINAAGWISKPFQMETLLGEVKKYA